MAFLYGILALYRINYGLAFDNMDIVHTYMHDLYFESAAMIVTLITLGKYLEVRSKSKTTDSIRKLMDLQPKIAHVIKDGQEADVPVEEAKTGDLEAPMTYDEALDTATGEVDDALRGWKYEWDDGQLEYQFDLGPTEDTTEVTVLADSGDVRTD